MDAGAVLDALDTLGDADASFRSELALSLGVPEDDELLQKILTFDIEGLHHGEENRDGFAAFRGGVSPRAGVTPNCENGSAQHLYDEDDGDDGCAEEEAALEGYSRSLRLRLDAVTVEEVQASFASYADDDGGDGDEDSEGLDFVLTPEATPQRKSEPLSPGHSQRRRSSPGAISDGDGEGDNVFPEALAAPGRAGKSPSPPPPLSLTPPLPSPRCHGAESPRSPGHTRGHNSRGHSRGHSVGSVSSTATGGGDTVCGQTQRLGDVLRSVGKTTLPDFDVSTDAAALQPGNLSAIYSSLAPLALKPGSSAGAGVLIGAGGGGAAGAAVLSSPGGMMNGGGGGSSIGDSIDEWDPESAAAAAARDPPCGMVLQCCVRPDRPADALMHCAARVAVQHGLGLRRKRGVQVLCSVPAAESTASRRRRQSAEAAGPSYGAATASAAAAAASSAAAATAGMSAAATAGPGHSAAATDADWGVWTHVDIQLVVSRATRHRVLLVRFVAPAAALAKARAEAEAADAATAAAAAAAGTAAAGMVVAGDVGSSGDRLTTDKSLAAAAAAAAAESAAWAAAASAALEAAAAMAGEKTVPTLTSGMVSATAPAKEPALLAIPGVTTYPGAAMPPVRRRGRHSTALAPSAVRLMGALKTALVKEGFAFGTLQRPPEAVGDEVKLDPQFLRQVETLCRDDMVASLRQAGRSLEAHACEAEERCRNVARLLEPMFELFGVDMPQPQPLRQQTLRGLALDVAAAGMGAMTELSAEDAKELAQASFDTEAMRVVAAVVARWCRYVGLCDAEMTSRMQRKNLQVMERIGRAQLHQRLLFQALRDDQEAVLTSHTAASFHRQIHGRCAIDPNVEGPIFYCGIVCGKRPGYLYLTYWHICLVLRLLPGFLSGGSGGSVVVVPFDEVAAVERGRTFLGEAVVLRRKDWSGADVVFAPTAVRAAELLDLISGLLRLHNEVGVVQVPQDLEEF